MSKNDLKDRKEKTKEVVYSVTPPFPKEILIDISSLCNHACNFCSNIKMTNKSHASSDGLQSFKRRKKQEVKRLDFMLRVNHS